MLGVQAWGGAVGEFRLHGNTRNPFTWKLTPPDIPPNNQPGAPFRGHFLCQGRWGAPTEGKMRAGVPHNSQSGNVCWQVTRQTATQLVMHSDAPPNGITLERNVWMDPNAAVGKVSEMINCKVSFARPFNVVQHVTIGAAFLDASTLIDCNEGRGFLQAMCYPDPHKYAFAWPTGISDRLRSPLGLHRSDEPFSYVSTHIFNDSIGWVTALNSGKKILLGYIWKTADYPWINILQQWQGTFLWAKGLEFGTSGIGKSNQDLLAIDSRFDGVPSFFLLDASEQVQKLYV